MTTPLRACARPIVPLACLVLLAALAFVHPALARDRLTIGITQFPSTLHPSIDSMAAKSYVLGFARRPITVKDAGWTTQCLLCVDLPSMANGLAEVVPVEDGPDGVKLTYTLHEDLRWGDGTPVSTDDVLFTQKVGSHPQSGVGNAELYRRITRIDVHDARSFTMHVSKLTFDYASIQDFQLLPAHLERAVFEEDPASYRQRTLYDRDSSNPGLYFGPYRVSEVVSGSHVALVRNEQWTGPAPVFDEIVVRTVENTAALEANLLAGQVDMIAGELGLPLDQALDLERRASDRFQIVYEAGLIYEHMDVNLGHPALGDRRVRQALMYAMDREAISQQLFDGRQPVAHTSVSPLDWIYSEAVPVYTRDLDKAAALLDEAGWTLGTDGVRVNQAGERLSLELLTTAGNRSRELVQQVIQSQLAEVGVDAVLRTQPPRVMFGETVTKRQFPALAMFAWISSPENVPRTTLHSTMIPTTENGWSGQNYTGYQSAAMDALIDAIEIELDPAAREKLWHRLQRLYAEDLPALPLFFRANAHIWPTWLGGVTPTGHLAPSSLWVETWRVHGS
ncbi:MAG: peptide ABC transporter substrate-binding protein [Geminicoccaceae bacterium]